MAAMTTTLSEFSNSINARTYTRTGHTASMPKIVIQKRRVPSGKQVVATDTVSIVDATTDVGGAILPEKVAFEVTLRRPVAGLAADVTTALAIFRDIVNSDEFTAMTTTQNYLKN